MSIKTIGYIINETASIQEPVRPKFDVVDGRVEFDTNLQDSDFTNRNGRFYASDELFPQITAPRTVELMRTRNLYGEAGHPMSKDIAVQQTVNPNNRNHLILNMWTEGKLVRGRIRAAATRVGDDFHRSIIDGTVPAFSLRALGSIEKTRHGAEVQNLRLITYDFVIFPSHKCAYGDTEGLVGKNITNESTLYLNESYKGLLIPINNEQVTNYIKSQSKNIKSVIESFELMYDDIQLMENGRQVKLISGKDIIVVNLEQSIHNEIMNYCWKR